MKRQKFLMVALALVGLGLFMVAFSTRTQRMFLGVAAGFCLGVVATLGIAILAGHKHPRD